MIESLPNAMPLVTITSCPFSLFSPPVKNHLKCPASLTQCGTGRLSDISALCRLWLFGTGLVMSDNASDCTQNAAYRYRKLKKNSGEGAQTLPPLKRGTPPPQTSSPDLEIWVWGPSRSLRMPRFDRSCMIFY